MTKAETIQRKEHGLHKCRPARVLPSVLEDALHPVARLGVFLLLLCAVSACLPDMGGPDEREFGGKKIVVTSQAAVYHRPDSMSRKLTDLRFGDEVGVHQGHVPGVPAGWEEVRTGSVVGFVRGDSLVTPERMTKVRELQESVAGIPVQALGVTTKSTYLRLAPGRGSTRLEKLPAGTPFEMFLRRATYRKISTPPGSPPSEPTVAPQPIKDIWYKIRLRDGRVGFVYTHNLKFDPPVELEGYTRFRRTVAWQELRAVRSKTGLTGSEYIVAYARPGVDSGADFDRIELYSWSAERGYRTPFARSHLKGILPLRVTRRGKDVYFEIRLLDPDKPGRLRVMKYHYPYPIKLVEETEIEEDVGLH